MLITIAIPVNRIINVLFDKENMGYHHSDYDEEREWITMRNAVEFPLSAALCWLFIYAEKKGAGRMDKKWVPFVDWIIGPIFVIGMMAGTLFPFVGMHGLLKEDYRKISEETQGRRNITSSVKD